MKGLKSKVDETTESAELHVLDDIGPSWAGMVGAKGVAAELKAIGDKVKSIDVHVNSLGGDVFEGYAIYNMLKQHKASITMHVDGVAASAASIIVMAGDRIVMAKSSYLMIHNAWSVAWGGAADFRKQADLLDSINAQIAGIYADRGSKGAEEFAKLMADETWLDPEQAIEAGMADEIDGNKSAVVNSLNPRLYQFSHAPERLQLLPKADQPPLGSLLKRAKEMRAWIRKV